MMIGKSAAGRSAFAIEDTANPMDNAQSTTRTYGRRLCASEQGWGMRYPFTKAACARTLPTLQRSGLARASLFWHRQLHKVCIATIFGIA